MHLNGYKGSLKMSVEKYTRRTIASSPELTIPTAAGPSTAPENIPTVAGPFTADIFFLNEDILLDDNVLDIGEGDKEGDKEDDEDSNSSEEDSSEESDSSSEED